MLYISCKLYYILWVRWPNQIRVNSTWRELHSINKLFLWVPIALGLSFAPTCTLGRYRVGRINQTELAQVPKVHQTYINLWDPSRPSDLKWWIGQVDTCANGRWITDDLDVGPAATTLTSWHLMVTFCTLHVAQRMGFFEPKFIDLRTVMLFGILNGVSIGFLNLSLGFNSIGFYQVQSNKPN